MALHLAGVGEYRRLGHPKLEFDHRDATIIVRHPPGQRNLDDFHPEDYQVRGQQQRRGEIAWAIRQGEELGSVILSSSAYETTFMAQPYGGLGPQSPFLAAAIDALLDEVEQWPEYNDPAGAASAHHLRETVLSDAKLGSLRRVDVGSFRRPPRGG